MHILAKNVCTEFMHDLNDSSIISRHIVWIGEVNEKRETETNAK